MSAGQFANKICLVTGGTQGVGEATTNAVVSASILILAANYLLTEAFF